MDTEKLQKALHIARQELRGHPTIRALEVFLAVAKHDQEGGVTQAELAKELGMISPRVNQNVLVLSEHGRARGRGGKVREKGAGLVLIVDDAHDLRKKRVILSPRGRKLLRKIEETLK